jgi:uncharacterized protein YjbJ (UPF0337 family)
MSINKEQFKGIKDQAAGKVKEVVGELVGNKDLKAEGSIQKGLGAVQSAVGNVKSDIVDTFKSK